MPRVFATSRGNFLIRGKLPLYVGCSDNGWYKEDYEQKELCSVVFIVVSCRRLMSPLLVLPQEIVKIYYYLRVHTDFNYF